MARKNSWKFFQNKDCAFYPCHKIEELNCKFCYCPLYHLEECGGNFLLIDGAQGKKIKDCSQCTYPHEYKNHNELLDKLMDSAPLYDTEKDHPS